MKPTKTQRTTIFRTLLTTLELTDTYHYEKRSTNYTRIRKGYERIVKNLHSYQNAYNYYVPNPNEDIFLSYLLSIYLYTDELQVIPNSFRSTFSMFIGYCLTNTLPPQQTSNKSSNSNQKRGYYRKHISNSDMSFFLRFFKEDSEITKKLGNPLSDTQKFKIDKLIQNRTNTPEEIFAQLIALFYPKKS